MTQRRFPEVDVLLKQVKDKFKTGVYTTNDYQYLSYVINASNIGSISVSTLKRVFGYVNDSHKPSISTLDILAKFVGYASYEDFYVKVLDSCAISSSFLDENKVWSKNLCKGNLLEIGWAPNRYVLLRYNGEQWFEVLESVNSKLLVGDTFKQSIFVINEPLHIAMVYRNGNELGPYIAGIEGGLVTLNMQTE